MAPARRGRMGTVVLVRRAMESDWERSRCIRLQALRQAPLAFASTYEREVCFDDGVWRQRICDSAQFLAFSDGDHLDDAVGTATGLVDPDDPTTMLLVAMYVTPAARGRGVGERLVAAVVAHARAAGARQVRLHVVETNAGAERLYARCGFVRTGETMRLPHRPDLLEHEMALAMLAEPVEGQTSAP